MKSTRRRVLHNAVMDNNLEELKGMLDSSATDANDTWLQIDARGYESENRTALGLACHLGYTEIVALLLERGASLHLESNAGLPLFEALINGHVDIARLLIAKGALSDLQSKPDRMSVMLYAAVAAGDTTILNEILALPGSHDAVLLAFAVQVLSLKNIADRLGDDAVSDRVYAYIVKVTSQMVREEEFDTHRKNLGVTTPSMAEARIGLKVTPALLARLINREDMLSLLLQHQEDAVHCQLDGRNHVGDADLVEAGLAIMNDDFDSLQTAYQRGVLLPNALPGDPYRAHLQEVAYIAAMHGRMHILRWLKQQGVKLTNIDEELKNPFVEALVEGEADAVDFLIAEGARFTEALNCGVKKISPHGQPLKPIEIASKLKHVNVVKVLLSHDVAHACVSDEILRPTYSSPQAVLNFLSSVSETLENNELYSREKWLESEALQCLITVTKDNKGCELIEEKGLLVYKIRNRSIAAEALKNYIKVVDRVRESEKEFIISKTVALEFYNTLRKSPSSWIKYRKQFPIIKELLANDKENILQSFPNGFRAEVKHRQSHDLLTLEMGPRSAALSRPVFMALGIENPVGCRQEIVLVLNRAGFQPVKLCQLLQARENSLIQFVTKARQIDKKCKVVYGETSVEVTFKNPQHKVIFDQAFPHGCSYEAIFAYDAATLAAIEISLPQAAVLENTIDLNNEVRKFNDACECLSTQGGVSLWTLTDDELVSRPLLPRFAAVLRSARLADMVIEAGDKCIARMPVKSLLGLTSAEKDSLTLQLVEGKRKIDLLDGMILKTWRADKKRFQLDGMIFELKDVEHQHLFNACCPGLVTRQHDYQSIYSIAYAAILALDIRGIEAANAKLCQLLSNAEAQAHKKLNVAAAPVVLPAAVIVPAAVVVPPVVPAVIAAAMATNHHVGADRASNIKKSGKPRATAKNKNRSTTKKVTQAASVVKPEKQTAKKQSSIAQQKINPLDLRGLPAPAPYVAVTVPCHAIDFTQPLSPRPRMKGANSRLFKPEKLNLVTEVSISFSALLECQQLVKARSMQHGRTNKILEKMQTTIINMEVCLMDLDALWQSIRLDQCVMAELGVPIIEFLSDNHAWVKSCEDDQSLKVMQKLEMICVHADEAVNVWNTRLLEDLQAARDLPLPASPRK